MGPIRGWRVPLHRPGWRFLNHEPYPGSKLHRHQLAGPQRRWMCVEMIYLQSHSRGRRGCRVNIYSKYSLRCERTENIVLSHICSCIITWLFLSVLLFFLLLFILCRLQNPPGRCPTKAALPTTGNPSPAVYCHTSLTHCLALVFQGRRGRVGRVPVPDR